MPVRQQTPPRSPTRGKAKQTTRAAWGTISREQVVKAAMKAVRDGSYEQLTIRSLAAELGVAPMSLYRHVRDKDDLLDEVVGRLLTDAWRPDADERDWKAWVAEAADRFRQFLVTQPAALHVYLRHPVRSPAAVERMEAMTAVLRHAAGSEEAARRAYAAVHTYTLGFAALEASRAGQDDADGATDRLTEQLSAYTTPGQFADGLRYLLEGIAWDNHGPRAKGPAARRPPESPPQPGTGAPCGCAVVRAQRLRPTRRAQCRSRARTPSRLLNRAARTDSAGPL